MYRAAIIPALLVLALSVCLASSADAGRRHYGDGERGSARSLDEWRARQAQGQNNEQSQDRDQTRGGVRGQMARQAAPKIQTAGKIVIATATIAGARAMTSGAAPARSAAAIARGS